MILILFYINLGITFLFFFFLQKFSRVFEVCWINSHMFVFTADADGSAFVPLFSNRSANFEELSQAKEGSRMEGTLNFD